MSELQQYYCFQEVFENDHTAMRAVSLPYFPTYNPPLYYRVADVDVELERLQDNLATVIRNHTTVVKELDSATAQMRDKDFEIKTLRHLLSEAEDHDGLMGDT